MFQGYYHMKIWSCDTIVCLFGVRSSWQVVWVSKKVNDPTMSGVVLVLMLGRSLLAWSRLWSKHKMHAAELCDDVESEVQASAVSVREFWCESHRQTLTGTYQVLLCIYIVDLRAIHTLESSTFSPQQLMLHWWWNIDGWKMRVLLIDNSTIILMWCCREDNGFFHERLP